ncbi:MAG: 50S ribosomal protein L32e [Thermoplasmata archaeon]|nr:50S ribosomal protein L32e [Thermoplasmata archaeon]
MPEDSKAKKSAVKEPVEPKTETEKPSKTAKKPKEEKYKPRAKPDITAEEKIAFNLRNDKSRNRPEFHRQEWFRYLRVGDKWRKPRGIHSKMRRHYGYRPNIVAIGYRGPKAARGKHPSGFDEVIIYNLKEMEGLNPKKQAIRIGHSVGYLKRMHIAILADEMELRILNFNRETHDELLAEAKKRGISLPSKEGGK